MAVNLPSLAIAAKTFLFEVYMIIEDFVRDEANEIYAVVAGEKIYLTNDYVVAHKPQIGDTLVDDTVVDEEPVEETKAK
jgi:hypothetical protein